MKKFVLLAVLVAAMPLTTMAQDDDLYFNPKQEVKKEAALREQRAKAYARVRAVRDSLYAIHWSGSPRSVDYRLPHNSSSDLNVTASKPTAIT